MNVRRLHKLYLISMIRIISHVACIWSPSHLTLDTGTWCRQTRFPRPPARGGWSRHDLQHQSSKPWLSPSFLHWRVARVCLLVCVPSWWPTPGPRHPDTPLTKPKWSNGALLFFSVAEGWRKLKLLYSRPRNIACLWTVESRDSLVASWPS